MKLLMILFKGVKNSLYSSFVLDARLSGWGGCSVYIRVRGRGGLPRRCIRRSLRIGRALFGFGFRRETFWWWSDGCGGRFGMDDIVSWRMVQIALLIFIF